MRRYAKRVAQKVDKLSKEQVETLLDMVLEENEMFDAVMESVNTGLLICDKSGNLLLTNKTAERLLPFNATRVNVAEQRAQATPVWNIIADSDISDFLRSVYDIPKNHTSEEFTLETAGGSVRIIVVTALPLVQKKQITGTLIQIEDVTEARNQQTLLRRMESLASLTNLAASVAHEIKNPLGAISIHIQLIQKALKKARKTDGLLPNSKFVENYLDVVNEEIGRLNKIIVDFLFAVRPIQAKLEPVNPNAIIISLMEFLKPELEKASVELKLEMIEKPPNLMLDVALFKQVIMNLAQNAVDAMKNGGILGIYTQVKNDHFIITVADTGEGMDEKTYNRIFEPYFTTKAKGTGLGLTMVYKIIKESAGEIDVRSFPGKGTVFTISLPVPQKDRRSLEFGGVKN
ncbi:MAG: PAS domain S-box protein [Treponema sp.]|jgi:PAS domain S-box-containing protein|nr:PAS domain S-box protein [Treponema sp.]